MKMHLKSSKSLSVVNLKKQHDTLLSRKVDSNCPLSVWYVQFVSEQNMPTTTGGQSDVKLKFGLYTRGHQKY